MYRICVYLQGILVPHKSSVPRCTMDVPIKVNVVVRHGLMRHNLSFEDFGAISIPDAPIVHAMRIFCECAEFICTFYDEKRVKYADIILINHVLRWNTLLLDSYPYDTNAITFGIMKPTYAEKTFQFLKVYRVNMWIAVLMCMLFAPFIMYFTFRQRISLLSSFFYVCSSFFGQYHDWKPQTNAQKLLIGCFNFGVMLISLGYCSVLLSMLTLPMREKGIKDSNGLYDAVRKGTVKLTDLEHSQIYVILLLSTDFKIHFLGEQLKTSSKIRNVFPAVVLSNSSIAMLNARYILEGYLNENYYFISNEDIFTEWITMIINPYSRCKDKVNGFIHRIWASGLYAKLKDDHEIKAGTLLLKRMYMSQIVDDDSVRPLNLSDLSGAFYILIFGHLLGLITCVLEYVHCCIS